MTNHVRSGAFPHLRHRVAHYRHRLAPGRLSEYDYDHAHQLIGADHNSQANESFAYDENGNRTMIGYIVGVNNQLLSDGAFNYEYDDEGNVLSRFDPGTPISTSPSKPSARIRPPTASICASRSSRRLRRADRESVDADGDGSGSAVVERFAFDQNGNIFADLNGFIVSLTRAAAEMARRRSTLVRDDAPSTDDDVTAIDEDGDTLTITASSKPAWLTLTDFGDGAATLGGTPAYTDYGAAEVLLLVGDGQDRPGLEEVAGRPLLGDPQVGAGRPQKPLPIRTRGGERDVGPRGHDDPLDHRRRPDEGFGAENLLRIPVRLGGIPLREERKGGARQKKQTDEFTAHTANNIGGRGRNPAVTPSRAARTPHRPDAAVPSAGSRRSRR